MSIILAGDRSGTGKTTLTLALLAALQKRGHSASQRLRHRIQSFKIGPDYIDPMFHTAVTGRPCYNLDPVLTSETYVQQSYRNHCAKADYTVVEGVMGLFDGASGVDDTASTAHIARLLNVPVLLAVDCASMSRSLAALVQGYRTFDSRVNVAGVVLNRVGSDRHLQLLQEALNAINMPIVGVFRREKDIELPSRHLGLVPTGEVRQFRKVADRLAVLGEQCFDWDELARLGFGQSQGELIAMAFAKRLNEKPSKGIAHSSTSEPSAKRVRIAIAQDAAFNFYYRDNLERLEEQGAELIEWSPITDKTLPEASGLYFGGGFPEVFAAELSANEAMRRKVRDAIAQGMPTYAECGGLMYLSHALVGFDGESWPMVGAIQQTVKMGGRLVLGYRQAMAMADGLLLTQGQTVTGHEFHKSSVVEPLTQPMYSTQRYWGGVDGEQIEGYVKGNLQASYVHLCWGDRLEIPQRFIAHCLKFQASQAVQKR
jgi:cobyrinic acid a,c-diamide synthase